MADQHGRQARPGGYRLFDGIGPMAGILPKVLATAGVNPADIDAVVITHVHPDHCNGLLTTDKQIAYPNATVNVNGDEFAWWMEGDVKSPRGQAILQRTVRRRPRGLQTLRRRQAGADLQGRRRARSRHDGRDCTRPHRRPHHDARHQRRRSIADLDGYCSQHRAAIPRARTRHCLDLDPPKAIATRKKVMDMAATDRC